MYYCVHTDSRAARYLRFALVSLRIVCVCECVYVDACALSCVEEREKKREEEAVVGVWWQKGSREISRLSYNKNDDDIDDN